MAPKRSTPLEDPPAASSSGEEEEETSSGEEEEEEEEEDGSSEEEEGEEQGSQKPLTQTQTPTAKQAPKKSEAESDSESGSESETDDDDDDDDKPQNPPDATVKPIASKPMEETPTKTTKPTSKPPAKSTTATATTTTKRGREVEQVPKDSKRAKKMDSEMDGVAAEKTEDTKKQLFQRLWSEDDELILLKGIIDFMEKKGVDPTKDMTSFFDYIKKSLHIDASLTQLKDKVLRLRKKFENHVKGKKGEEKTFSKVHDQTTFDLSKKIWGAEGTIGGLDSSLKSNGKAKKIANNSSNSNKSLVALKAELGMDVDKGNKKVDKMDVEIDSHSSGLKQIDKSAGFAGMEDYVIKRGLDVVVGAKKAEMEEKWRKLHVAELELFLKRNELIREQAKLMLASYKDE